MEQILQEYYADNAKKLHKTVDHIIVKFGGISDKDVQDFYSLANEVFVDVMKKYDNSQPFDSFLYSCLQNRMKSEMTRRNREKRRIDRMSVSIDAPVGDEEDSTIGDLIAGRFDVEREVLGDCDDRTVRIETYLNSLTKRQRRVAKLLAEAYSPGEIQNILHITQKEYADALSGIHAYENISLLFL